MLQRPFGSALSALLLATALATSAAAAPLALQITSGWNATSPNSGTIGGDPVTAVAANDLWWPTSPLTRSYADTNVWGSLALPGTAGQMFALAFASGDTETVTITFGAQIEDPIFYFIDFDAPGATVTVPSGGASFVCLVDCTWSGDTATTTAGSGGAPSGSPAVQYTGIYLAGSQFTFDLDWSGVAPIGGDIIGIGVGTQVPEPTTGTLLGAGLIAMAARMRRRPGATPTPRA